MVVRRVQVVIDAGGVKVTVKATLLGGSAWRCWWWRGSVLLEEEVLGGWVDGHIEVDVAGGAAGGGGAVGGVVGWSWV
jgi:hypothetical protein